MGTDGHTASLFPGDRACDETERWVVNATAPQAPTRRVTLTFPAIEVASEVLFLVAGSDKVPVWEAIHGSDGTQGAAVPAARVRCRGPVQWYVVRD